MDNKNSEELSSLRSWITDKKNEWKKINVQKDTDAVRRFLSSISRRAFSLKDQDQLKECLLFLESCNKPFIGIPEPLVDSERLRYIGFRSYEKGYYPAAEIAFRILTDVNDAAGKNNYAYMIRRGEISDPASVPPLKALFLLRDCMNEPEPFAAVNMALTFALCFGTDKDWRLADEIMKNMINSNITDIMLWYSSIAENGDVDGVLVHYFLLRHKKIRKSDLGTEMAMSKLLESKIRNFPEWLKAKPRFNSLDDVFSTFMDNDFDNSLIAYLDDMPRNKESAEEILKEIDIWDEWLLYKVLLQDFRSFLSPEELNSVIYRYKKKFSVPLPQFSAADNNGNE